MADNDKKTMAYLSGAVTNNPLATEQFAKAQEQLQGRYDFIFNPTTMLKSLDWLGWQPLMDICEVIIKKADVIYQLPGWEKSQGANREKVLAEELSIPLLPLPPEK